MRLEPRWRRASGFGLVAALFLIIVVTLLVITMAPPSRINGVPYLAMRKAPLT